MNRITYNNGDQVFEIALNGNESKLELLKAELVTISSQIRATIKKEHDDSDRVYSPLNPIAVCVSGYFSTGSTAYQLITIRINSTPKVALIAIEMLEVKGYKIVSE